MSYVIVAEFQVKTGRRRGPVDLEFEVLTALVAPKSYPRVEIVVRPY